MRVLVENQAIFYQISPLPGMSLRNGTIRTCSLVPHLQSIEMPV